MNRPLQTLTLAAALSCTMATVGLPFLHKTPNQQNNDYEMFMEKIRNTTIKNPSIDKNLACFRKTAHLATLIMMIPR
mgnify:CR=1 FL=1